jgi:hypothetical protein
MRKLIGLIVSSALALALAPPRSAVAGTGERGGQDASPPARWERVVLPGSRLAFDVAPVRGVDVRLQAHPAPADNGRMRESATLRVAGTERVRLDVWRVAREVDEHAWFAAHFDKELDELSSLWTDAVGVDATPALRVSRPAACGVLPRELVVVHLGGAMVVLSLADATDHDALGLFDAVLATLEPVEAGGL